MPSDESPTEKAAYSLARQGVAVVLLRPESKRPVLNNWTDLPRMTEADLARRMRPDMNIGIRLGEPSEVGPRRWVHGIDLDIRRDADAAWGALLDLFPDAERWPCVRSGSGGDSRHLYLLSDAPFRKINLARSVKTMTVETADGPREKPLWEIDLYGTGAQMVLPPSIHPDTRKAYRWCDGDEPRSWLDDLPFVRQTKLAPLFTRRGAKRDRRDYPVEPIDNLLDILDTRALENDGGGLHYDEWRDVIFAVKQEYDGTDLYDEAFQALEEWSAKSDKHDQKRFEEVWDHARTDRVGGITLGTLKKKTRPEIVERRQQGIVDSMDDERTEDEVAGRPKGDEWMRGLKRDGVGELTNCAENRILILLNEPSMTDLVWAAEEQRPVWRKPEVGTIHPNLKNITFGDQRSLPYDPGAHYQLLQICFSRTPYLMDTVRKEELNDSVRLATQKRPWHRIQELVHSAKWDGKRRVEFLLQDYLGVRDGAYARDVSKLLVLGPMSRILWRGVKVDYAPILQGSQGTGKDRFLELLCTFDGDECLYTASPLDLTKPSEYTQTIRGKLIVHLAEMATFKRTTNEQMKTFLTEHEDTARLSYEAVARTYRRLCIFVFSVNETGGYLTDATGNRRFLPVVLGDPKPGPDGKPTAYKRNFSELERERAQIWAEAYEMAMEEAERQGGRVRELLLSNEGLRTARKLQGDKLAELPEHDLAARGERLLDIPVPLDDLLAPEERSDVTAKQMGVRNQVGIREFWSDVLGERKDNWHRNTHLTGRALDLIPGWTRVEGRQVHMGESRVVYRRDGTDGKPSVRDDMAAPAKAKVFDITDERRKRRAARDE